MKKQLLLLMISLGLVFSAQSQTLKLSDLGPSLASFEGKEGYDFLMESVSYKQLDKPNYDNAFLESAKIFGTLKQTDGMLNAIDNGSVSPVSKYAVSSVKFALDELPKFTDRIPELQQIIGNMNPKNDFKGLKEMKKVPDATSGVSTAQSQLSDAASILPGILERVEAISSDVLGNE